METFFEEASRIAEWKSRKYSKHQGLDLAPPQGTDYLDYPHRLFKIRGIDRWALADRPSHRRAPKRAHNLKLIGA